MELTIFTLHCSSELFTEHFTMFSLLRCGLPWYTFKGTPYERRQVRTVSGFLHFQIDFQPIFTLTNINLNMVFHRIQYENMSKEEFIQELTDINSRFVNDINTEQSFRKT